MKITKIETLHCDAGWRIWSFIKISTDEDIIGYSECTDSHGSAQGIAGVIKDLESILLGKDPRAFEKLCWDMYCATRQSPGSIIQKAIGGIENALLDIKAKELGIPVYGLFGGPLRDRIRVYWSHCGTTRARAWKIVNKKPLRSMKDVTDLGHEVVNKGFSAVRMTDPYGLEIYATIIEEDYTVIEVGQLVEVFFDALPEHTVLGRA